ncbi:MAG: TonB-dependent receptor [Gracilimonas sp.]|uniref:SusC/RagA family TonB-linked outer membrane protein n=1 Tax=Gracilimonas sp. TaxID=1974203 RepID=UPI0019AE01F0|nr:TonB-dependent receptor [Gracilimonas sp.]MBD3616391.1 TonB-dependent receptor [Gracilimonas sp.]
MFKKLLFTVFALLLSASAYAQSGTLTGQITDAETGDPLIGATVYIESINRGTQSDLDGNYTISGIDAGTYTVSFRYVGYVTVNEVVQIGSGTVTRNVELSVDVVGLDEFVVSGYAVQQKREVTGSITTVSSQELENVSLQNTESLLQGRAAGVNITTTSGNPGGAFRVNIRGNGSINAATEPLYIVDGVQISFSQLSSQASTSPLNTLNPSDIESIEVLKDAASAAIYGAQAAAGVVIITTKQGSAGPTQITARTETGIRSLARNVDYINSEEYVQYLGEGRAFLFGETDVSEDGADISAYIDNRRDFLLGFFGEDPNNPGELANTDWQDFIFSDGVTQKYNISAAGGNSSTSFRLSGGYESTEGTAFNSDFTRLNLRTNIDHELAPNWRTGIRLNLSRSGQGGVCQDGNFINCPPSQAMFEAPMSFPYLADGSYNPNTRFGEPFNPAVVKNEVDRQNTVTQILSSIRLQYQANDWLSFNSSVNVDYRNTQDEQYRSAIAAPSQNGWISFANRNVENYQGNLLANFTQTFDGIHAVSGFVGTEYRSNYSESQVTRGDGLPGPFFTVLSATSTPTTAAGINSEWRQASYFGNAKYTYDEKYILNVVARYDGNSRFGQETRWGFFPSVSVGWRITEEDFLNVEAINELKLRAGYGTTGNSAIGNFASRGLYSASGSYLGSTGLRPTQLANANLGWEEARELNIGLDYEFFDGRLYGAIDAYRKDNTELLFDRPLPSDSGYGSITENIGKVRNTGIEFELNSVNVVRSGFRWQSRFNVSFSDNEILELPDGEPIREDGTFNSLQEGKPIGLIQVVRWAGVNPADGRPMWYDADGNITYTPTNATDAVEYKDGVANIVGGFGNTISYKGLSLDAFFQFSFGQWAFPNTDYYFTRTPDFLMQLSTEVNDRWKEPGDITHYPHAIGFGPQYPETANYRTQLSTASIYNASYIRLKNISLNYSLPDRFTQKVGLNNVTFFASAVNLVTWTAWPWYDPEVAFSPNDIYNNLTAASYPTERQVNAGIEIQF